MEKTEEKDGRKYWVLNMDTEEALNRVSLDSNYREHAMQQGGSRYVLMEDDQALYALMLKRAVNDLWLKLARMSKAVAGGLKYSDDGVVMRLEVSDNYDDNMLFTLGGFVERFIDSCVLRQWYERNNLQAEAVKCGIEAEVAVGNILNVVHFRKRAVKRPVNPVF